MMRRVPRLAALASQQKPGSGVMLSSWVIGVDWRGYSPFPDKKRCTHENEWDEGTGKIPEGRSDQTCSWNKCRDLLYSAAGTIRNAEGMVHGCDPVC